MKHFILRGLLPEPFPGGPHLGGDLPTSRSARRAAWKNTAGPLPREGLRPILRVSTTGRISIFVYDVFNAVFIISASSQRKAYGLAALYKAYCSVYLGLQIPDSHFEWLIELDHLPDPTDTAQEIAAQYKTLWAQPVNTAMLTCEIRTGAVVFESRATTAASFVGAIVNNSNLNWALLHLEQSHALLSGYMTSSYYMSHYSRDRQSEPPYFQEKKYLEQRVTYDLAFISAFRAVESLMGTTQVKKAEITKRLKAMDGKYGTDFGTTKWRSPHEVFSSRRKLWTLRELISKYLVLRNAVAAHSNPTAPFKLGEDQVFELQSLAEYMLFRAAGLSV